MPCDVVQTNSIDWKVADLDTLEKGLKAAGFDVSRSAYGLSFRKVGESWMSLDKRSGQVTFRPGQEDRINEAKRAYSVEVVKQTGAKFGWQVKQVGPNKYQYLKR